MDRRGEVPASPATRELDISSEARCRLAECDELLSLEDGETTHVLEALSLTVLREALLHREPSKQLLERADALFEAVRLGRQSSCASLALNPIWGAIHPWTGMWATSKSI